MSRNGLHRHYDRLTPEERFRLDVLAMVRGDMRESECLVGILRILDMAFRTYVEIAGHLDRLKMLKAARLMLSYQEGFARDRTRGAFVAGHRAGTRQAWEAAGGDGPAPGWPREGIDEAKVDELAGPGASILPGIFDGLERKQATDALTLWRGFGAFCEETLGLDAGEVLRIVLEPGAERVEELEATAESLGLEPDAEAVREIREGLAEAWGVVEARGI